ncbi:hypothetical protein [Streptomyces sp. ISL-43]|uniref:hypothetical protein n=1 Tax=Streptomyces sp. ISL-43 TaxID=2819183 RepID=UPI0020351BCA|nr:hypothetical protein [Streptomyces sp. ISL-43]
MPAVMRGRAATIVFLAALATAQAVPAAHADRGGGSKGGVKGQNGQNITAETKIQVSVPGNPGSAKTGTLSSEDGNWTPPACWYEPAFSPKEIESTVKAIDGLPFFGDVFAKMLNGYYKDGTPYKDYNLDKQGKGMFWASVVNPKRKDDPAATSCDKLPFWVDNGATPSEPLAVSPQVLAEYAYDELRLPDTTITMKPADKSTVNLPTWAWLDKSTFRPVSVTASIPNSGLSATTTATPVSLKIDPGTADAQLHPAGGACTFAPDGSIGAPFSPDKANQTPPCGVTYLRATTGSGPHKLRATVTWKVEWTSSTGGGGTLPSGTFGTTQDVTVQEIQAINR